MKFTTHFMHQSQGTWLLEDTPCTESCKWHTGLSPLSMLFSKGLLLHLNWWHISISQFRTRCPDFQTEPVLMHSPLLKESLWVSLPPPTYMLKFSGLAGLSSCFEKGNGLREAFQLQKRGSKPAHSKGSQGHSITCGWRTTKLSTACVSNKLLWHIKHAAASAS